MTGGLMCGLKDFPRQQVVVVRRYLYLAEKQAVRRTTMTMYDWAAKLHAFLTLNDYEILQNAGKVKAEMAKAPAHEEYEKFRTERNQRLVSDFDQLVKKAKGKK